MEDNKGFPSYNVNVHTSDEVEFRIKCTRCGMSAMDAENSCLTCDCDWFQSRYNDNDDAEPHS